MIMGKYEICRRCRRGLRDHSSKSLNVLAGRRRNSTKSYVLVKKKLYINKTKSNIFFNILYTF